MIHALIAVDNLLRDTADSCWVPEGGLGCHAEWNKWHGLAMSCLIDVFWYAEGQYTEYMFDGTVTEQWLVDFSSATNHSLLEEWIDLECQRAEHVAQC
jgi:hypothetical protein